MPTVVTSPVGCPKFSMSQAVSSGLCPSTYVVPSRSVSSDLDTLTPVFEFRQTKFEMADRRYWGGGGDDLEESTQRMIERIWESLTDIQRRMDQQVPVPPVAMPPGDGETVPIAPVPPGVEVPFVAPVPPPPPVLLEEEPVMQVEKFLRLQPPTYLGGPNPDTLPCIFSPVLRARGARAEVVSSRSCRGRGRGAWSEEEVVIPT
ncbi:hypothetical protein Taro_017588 [Colocasia esculenta]|uniref:Uncharacterized protein n=1 Tax=Colocasia esculenta TaxID=4460 RepID=A0A843UGJ6_COLES|nr:hypothetical protein [Colocasia esculenta]